MPARYYSAPGPHYHLVLECAQWGRTEWTGIEPRRPNASRRRRKHVTGAQVPLRRVGVPMEIPSRAGGAQWLARVAQPCHAKGVSLYSIPSPTVRFGRHLNGRLFFTKRYIFLHASIEQVL